MDTNLSNRVRSFLKQASATMEATEQMEKHATAVGKGINAARKAKKTFVNIKRPKLPVVPMPDPAKNEAVMQAAKLEAVPGFEGFMQTAPMTGDFGGTTILRDYARTKPKNAKPSIEVLHNLISPEAQLTTKIKAPRFFKKKNAPAPETGSLRAEASLPRTFDASQITERSTSIPGALKAKPTATQTPSAGYTAPTGQAGSYLDAIRAWAKEHPIATPAIAAGASSAGTGALGYGIGKSNGKKDSSDIMSQYYKMREFINAQRLASANSSFLNRLANVFGGGDLSNMIG